MRFSSIHTKPSLRSLRQSGSARTHYRPRPWPERRQPVLTQRIFVSQHASKRAFDLVGAILLIGLFAPLFLVLALWIRAADGGPAIFGHWRVGRDGRRFRCYKFRSMVPDAQQILHDYLVRHPDAMAEWNASFKLRTDPRVTPFGAFLRKSSLDELPQLFNVLLGDMSLVGPRPIVWQELEKYGAARRYYLSIRPGITGLWQVKGRSDTSYEARVEFDRHYVMHWNFWTDIYIVAATLPAVLMRRGAY